LIRAGSAPTRHRSRLCVSDLIQSGPISNNSAIPTTFSRNQAGVYRASDNNGETVQTMYGESPQKLQKAEIGSGFGVYPAGAGMQRIPGAVLSDIEAAAHFMIATHPEQVAKTLTGAEP
jgi:hypothetical protein